VKSTSTYDAAHLHLTHVKSQPTCGLPIPTTATVFEVVVDGKIHHVAGARLKDVDRTAPAGMEWAASDVVQSAPDVWLLIGDNELCQSTPWIKIR
jgi:hypothetical protein